MSDQRKVHTIMPAGLFGLLLPGSAALASAPPPGTQMIPAGHLGIEGGGTTDVQGTVAAVGHRGPPFAATLLDDAEPARPLVLSRVRRCELTNDVFVDERGLVCLIDGVRGLGILRPGERDGQ